LPLPVVPLARLRDGGRAELTSLELKRQSKPFVNLNWAAAVDSIQKEKSRLSAGPSSGSHLKLAPLARFLVLAGILAGTVRVLLLLTGLSSAALLLSWLLARILILLTGVLVLIGHCNLPRGLDLVCWTKQKPTREQRGRFCRNRHVTVSGEPGTKLPLYKPFKPQLPVLPPKGFHC
jgi:hypothetical protein